MQGFRIIASDGQTELLRQILRGGSCHEDENSDFVILEEVKSIISVVIIAALIGMCVGGLSEYLYTGNFFPGLAIGALSGVVIGAICNYAFIFVYFKFRNPLLAGISFSL